MKEKRMHEKKITVLVVDDSALTRRVLSEILNADPDIEVMATASNPYRAAEVIKKHVPDVITLDEQMPRMDGLMFLKVIMSQRPIPVILVSSLTERARETTLKALELGALDVIKKPTMSALRNHDDAWRLHLIGLVKSAASVKLKARKKASRLTAKTTIPARQSPRIDNQVVLIGASTGGTKAIKSILTTLPADCPAMVIVQHMPEGFTRFFADRLNSVCKMAVKEAINGDRLVRGQVLIAPGNFHTQLRRDHAGYFVEVVKGEPVNRHRPSVDVLFTSAARCLGANGLGVLLTGMGKDGARGLLALKEVGATTIAQDEESSIVFGMPGEAIKLNAAHYIEAIEDIPEFIVRL